MNTETISIKEGNKLIAEFMGINPLNSPVTGFARKKDYAVEPFGYFDAPDLKYHTSWDWLMPVVEKIRRMWNENTLDLQLLEENSDASRILHKRLWTPIEDAWLAVVEFIKWYNENK